MHNILCLFSRLCLCVGGAIFGIFFCTGLPLLVYFLYTVGFLALFSFFINLLLSLLIKKKKKNAQMHQALKSANHILYNLNHKMLPDSPSARQHPLCHDEKRKDWNFPRKDSLSLKTENQSANKKETTIP